MRPGGPHLASRLRNAGQHGAPHVICVTETWTRAEDIRDVVATTLSGSYTVIAHTPRPLRHPKKRGGGAAILMWSQLPAQAREISAPTECPVLHMDVASAIVSFHTDSGATAEVELRSVDAPPGEDIQQSVWAALLKSDMALVVGGDACCHRARSTAIACTAN